MLPIITVAEPLTITSGGASAGSHVADPCRGQKANQYCEATRWKNRAANMGHYTCNHRARMHISNSRCRRHLRFSYYSSLSFRTIWIISKTYQIDKCFSELFSHHSTCVVPIICIGNVCISPTLAAGGIINPRAHDPAGSIPEMSNRWVRDRQVDFGHISCSKTGLDTTG